MAVSLFCLSFVFGPVQIFKVYGVPYLVGWFALFFLEWTFVDSFRFICFRSFFMGFVNVFADFCNVVGYCYLLASPWTWAETSMVPWKGSTRNNYPSIRKLVDWLVYVIEIEWFWQEWSYLRGGLTTVDRDYGWFNNIHHDIGTHVIHHLFPQIPHYHLVEAVRNSLSTPINDLHNLLD